MPDITIRLSPSHTGVILISPEGREFAIPVPKDMKTAMQANLWTYNLEGGASMLPEVRT